MDGKASSQCTLLMARHYSAIKKGVQHATHDRGEKHIIICHVIMYLFPVMWRPILSWSQWISYSKAYRYFTHLHEKFCLLLLRSEFSANRCELLFKSQGCVPTRSLPFSAFSAAAIPSSTRSLYVNLASIFVRLRFFCYSFSISLLVLSAWVKSNWIFLTPMTQLTKAHLCFLH